MAAVEKDATKWHGILVFNMTKLWHLPKSTASKEEYDTYRRAAGYNTFYSKLFKLFSKNFKKSCFFRRPGV